jgi:hypothetical protein
VTTAAFTARTKYILRALDHIKRQHCAAPNFAPAAQVDGHMDCPKCRSRLNFTVLVSGKCSGRCVAANCIRWSDQ